MKQDNATLTRIFSFILSQEGITAPIQWINVKGLRDEPGFHWSNPGLKSVSVTAGNRHFSFVVKRLGKRAKREVLVYRFLSNYEGFPIPRLFHNMYDDDKGEYWIVTECCIGRPFDRKEQFWEQCGLLLARIHVAFWDKTDALPDLFRTEPPTDRTWTAVKKLIGFLDSLPGEETVALEHVAGPTLSDLRTALEGVSHERLPVAPPPANCLIHKSFHPPEIMWRQTDEGYVPVAVDWETARIGAPQEDFRVAGQLLAQGEDGLVQVLLDSYLDELNTHGISLSRDQFLIAVRGDAILDQMETTPWLVSEYLRRRDDKSFAKWCEWVVKEIPRILGYMRCGIEEGEICQG